MNWKEESARKAGRWMMSEAERYEILVIEVEKPEST